MNLETRNKIISLVLGVIVLFLGYYLYRSIVDPYQEVIQAERMKQRVQHRMTLVRDALVQYRNVHGNFPPTDGGLDSVIQFVKTHPRIAPQMNELFKELPPYQFNPDSLKFSPVPPHSEFRYTLNDSIRPQIYLLEDPDSDLRIGDLHRTTMLNAPNWN